MLDGFRSKTLLVKKGPKSKVSTRPTKLKALYADESDYEKKLKSMQDEMSDLQEALYAEKRQALLVIFQGMDASGKDSAIKHVLSGLNPQGVVVTSFSKPSQEDLEHDFLWRTHKYVPARGRIGVFNRSYYEEVLTVRVHHPEFLENQRLPKAVSRDKNIWQHRLQDINNHELYLDRQGIHVVKFLLHVSKEEQRQRFLQRLQRSEKHWKFDPSDFQDRRLWNKFERAYDACIPATCTAHAPWYSIPADDKKNARLMIAHIILERLHSMHPEYPEVTEAKKRELKRIERALQRG